MRIDVVIASRNGAAKLRTNLWRFPMRSIVAHGVKLILVDNGSDDDTLDVMRSFAREHPPAIAMSFPVPSQFLAQNAALKRSEADLVVFTDDDCLPSDDYFDILQAKLDLGRVQYGGGEIVVSDTRLDMRVANTHWWSFEGDLVIPPHSLVMAGMIQGANMFFGRALLERIGGLKPLGRKGVSDALTVYDASSAGFTGILMRGPKVQHRHGKLAGSAEADATEHHYNRNRGAYYAAVLARGDTRAFDLWKSQCHLESIEKGLERLRMEFAGAADALV